MQISTDQAVFLCNFLVADMEREAQTTAKVLAAMPADRGHYQPAEKCMTALALANHIATADVFLPGGIVHGEYKPENRPTFKGESPAEIAAWYEAEVPKVLAQIRALTPEALAKPVDFFGFMTMPAIFFLHWAIKHSVHHRGQLSSYLRPMGAKVPGIYGPSGDTPVNR